MKCKICGSNSIKKIDDNVYVCEVCGVEFLGDEIREEKGLEVYFEAKEHTSSTEFSDSSKLKKTFSIKKLLYIGLPAIAVLLCSILLFTTIMPLVRYNKAIKLIESAEFKEAHTILNKLGNYKDAERIKNEAFLNLAEIGDTVFFGAFEQDNNEENGADAIEWYVIDKKEDSLLSLSKYCLTAKAFHQYGNNIWLTSDVRNWLNNDFFKMSFSENEKNRIKYTINSDLTNEQYNYYEDACDKVFLLSKDEVEQYLNDDQRIAEGTLYAKKRGAFEKTSNWWTRTKGDERSNEYQSSACVTFVDTQGILKRNEYDSFADTKTTAVRPAVWISLKKNEVEQVKEEYSGLWVNGYEYEETFEEEITITEISDDTITFDVFFYRVWDASNVTATIQKDGKAYFTTEDGIEGNISFCNGMLLFEITKSTSDFFDEDIIPYKRVNSNNNAILSQTVNQNSLAGGASKEEYLGQWTGKDAFSEEAVEGLSLNIHSVTDSEIVFDYTSPSTSAENVIAVLDAYGQFSVDLDNVYSLHITLSYDEISVDESEGLGAMCYEFHRP